MITFDPPIASRSSEELIFITHAPSKWQPEAVEQANQELEKRGVPLPVQRLFFENHQEQLQAAWQRELAKRSIEGYSLPEKAMLILKWPIKLLSGWNLRADGYERKAKQRIKYMLIGVGCWAALLVYIQIDAESMDQEKRREIESIDVSAWEKEYYGTDSWSKASDSLKK